MSLSACSLPNRCLAFAYFQNFNFLPLNLWSQCLVGIKHVSQTDLDLKPVPVTGSLAITGLLKVSVVIYFMEL